MTFHDEKTPKTHAAFEKTKPLLLVPTRIFTGTRNRRTREMTFGRMGASKDLWAIV